MHNVAPPILVGILPCSRYLDQMLHTAILSSGWGMRWIEPAQIVTFVNVFCDALVLVVDDVSDKTLSRIEDISQECAVPFVVVARGQGAQVTANVLGAGADEYMVYPFVLDELLARLERLVQRTRGVITYHPPTIVNIDQQQHIISNGERHLSLSQREWSLFKVLYDHRGQVLSVEDLARLESSTTPTPAAVISTISRLRKHLERSSFDVFLIEPVHERGYAMYIRGDAHIVV